MTLLLAKKVSVLAKYLDFTDVFLKKSANIFLKQNRANKYMIRLEKDKQPSYGLIYSLKPVEFETLKTYIKINLANGFIQASKLPVAASILFVRKPNNSFWLYVNY